MQLDILAIAVFLELQLYVSWGTPRQMCPQTPHPGNTVPFLVDPHLPLKVQPSIFTCLNEPNIQTTLIFEDKDYTGPRASEIQPGAMCSTITQAVIQWGRSSENTEAPLIRNKSELLLYTYECNSQLLQHKLYQLDWCQETAMTHKTEQLQCSLWVLKTTKILKQSNTDTIPRMYGQFDQAHISNISLKLACLILFRLSGSPTYRQCI